MFERALRPLGTVLIGLVAISVVEEVSGQRRGRRGRDNAEARALAEPFKGITTDGTVVPGLFTVESTGVSTEPVVRAAERFLASLTDEQRRATQFPVDDDEWRKWQNVQRYDRQGISRRRMTEAQEEHALGLLRAGLSAAGFAKARDIMTLNGVLADLLGDREEYGEDLYFFTVMGTPSSTEPWGWQLDGHHLVINYFVFGDQVVMTPTFMGSEPVRADSGPHAGLRVFGPEEARGLAMMRSLDAAQQAVARIADQPIRQVLTPAFRDNFELRYEGISARDLDAGQRRKLLELIGEYVGNLADGHAAVRMAEIEAHLDETRFAWMGGTGDESVFYYRVHSPVVLIEFDHQGGIALRTEGMTRNHIHTVFRTPNGNDYGKDLLRQHHEEFEHVDGRHVRRRRQPEAAPPRPARDGPPAGALVTRFADAIIGPPPDSLGLDPFYVKHADAFGIPVVASTRVPDAALLVTRDVMNYMLAARPDVRAVMVEQGFRVAIMARSEMQTDLPEYRDWKKPARDDRRLTPRERERYDQPGGIGSMTDREYWNRRARGMGGRLTSCAEENVLGYPGTRYFGENILVHEFSHGVMSALRTADPELYQEIQDAYRDAKEAGRFKGHYAENTVAEYWAEGSQWWFWSNYEWFDGDQRLQTPEDLRAYDPRLYGILAQVYPGHRIPADVYHGRNLRRGGRRPRLP